MTTGTVNHVTTQVHVAGNPQGPLTTITFWGIVGDDGNNYVPYPESSLPQQFQAEGARIGFDWNPVFVTGGGYGWGSAKLVAISNVQPAGMKTASLFGLSVGELVFGGVLLTLGLLWFANYQKSAG